MWKKVNRGSFSNDDFKTKKTRPTKDGATYNPNVPAWWYCAIRSTPNGCASLSITEKELCFFRNYPEYPNQKITIHDAYGLAALNYHLFCHQLSPSYATAESILDRFAYVGVVSDIRPFAHGVLRVRISIHSQERTFNVWSPGLDDTRRGYPCYLLLVRKTIPPAVVVTATTTTAPPTPTPALPTKINQKQDILDTFSQLPRLENFSNSITIQRARENEKVPIRIEIGDITHLSMHYDAIVNAANPQLSRGGGVCGDIFQSSDTPDHKLEREIKDVYKGQTFAPGTTHSTNAYGDLATRVKRIYHSIPPNLGSLNRYPSPTETKQLKSAYTSALDLLATENGKSIVFPLLGIGLYSYDAKSGIEHAVEAVTEWLQRHRSSGVQVAFAVQDQKNTEILQWLQDAVSRVSSPPDQYQSAIAEDVKALEMLKDVSPSQPRHYWRFEPYISLDGRPPPIEFYSSIEDAWTGQYLYIGRAGYVHKQTAEQVQLIAEYCYPTEDKWSSLLDLLPETDVLVLL